MRAACLLALSLVLSPLPARACRIALALAVDVSRSISPGDYAIQREGIVAALEDPEVRAAFFAPGGPVALGIYEWAGAEHQQVVADWRLIAGPADLDAVAALVAGRERPTGDLLTALGAALEFGRDFLARAPPCDVQVLDVSGDGRNNAGPAPARVYARADFGAITVNGLAIGQHEMGVVDYYRAEVIRGPGAFVEVAARQTDFPPAIRRKLIRELTPRMLGQVPPPGAGQTAARRVCAGAAAAETDEMQGSANLNLMIKAARRAARSLVKDFREVENLQVSAKGPGDFVSKADREAERIIREELMGGRPTYGWLGEETGETPGEDPTRRWIVDPLDGTTNFLHGLPHWAISIALEHKGEVVSGVIYDPAKDEMFWAEKGTGAWLNDNRRLRVSGRTRMIEAIFATGVPFAGRPALPATLADLARLMPVCAGVRRWGAAALDMAYVAAGRYEGYWERGIHAWDMAAGMIIVREAGGLATGIREGDRPLEKGAVICGNAGLFEEFRGIIRG